MYSRAFLRALWRRLATAESVVLPAIAENFPAIAAETKEAGRAEERTPL